MRKLLLTHRLKPDFSGEQVLGISGGSTVKQATFIDDRHLRTELLDVLHDVRRQNNNNIFAHFSEKIIKAVTFPGIQPGSRLIHNQ